jgi:hypothetical protein
MDDNMIMESSFSAAIDAPIEDIDLPSWCYTLPDAEYQARSPAHCAAGATTTPDGRRMSINVEVIGGITIVQHYIEEVGEPDHLRLVSTSDLFTPAGRTTMGVIWDLSVKPVSDHICELTSYVRISFTPELRAFLGKQGIPVDLFRTARRPFSEAHNRQETSPLAKSIERHALRRREAVPA